MFVYKKFFNLAPDTLDENEYTALSILISKINDKSDIIKVDEAEMKTIFGYGRDRTDQVMTSLANKKFITREQKRDSAGKFTYNEIRIITDLVE